METFTRDGLTFDVTDRGPAGGRVVIALHGFPEDRHCWDGITGQLTAAGYRVVAPDQRGYSPRARPVGRSSYTGDKLRDDVLALADAAGADRFDVIGHDWGGLVAWDLAARRPDRVRSLVALSTPHPRAVPEVMLHSTQLLHSWYVLAFQIPLLPEAALRATGAARGAEQLRRDGLDAPSAERYAARFVQPGAMTGPINWYRALPYGLGHPTPDVEVPTLYVWSDGDRYLTRAAAEGTARHVKAPYRLEILAGQSHWLPSAAPDLVGPLVLEHLSSVAA